MFSALVFGVWWTPLLICGAEAGANVSLFMPIIWLVLRNKFMKV